MTQGSPQCPPTGRGTAGQRMGRRTGHVELGLVGRKIEDRDVEPVVVDLDHPEGAHQAPVPVGQRGAPPG